MLNKPIVCVLALAVTGCAPTLNELPGVYRIAIRQGNQLNSKMTQPLFPGMNKRQVLFALGSPMLVDPFHPNRWDYIFSEQQGGGPRLQKHLTLYFEDDRLSAVAGDFKPAATPPELAGEDTTLTLPKREFEPTLADIIGSWFGLEPEAPVFVE
ncbi:MAG: outer membrane protein assembly factor BamE [Methylococcales bacterium]|nr:outer membrane protein assembly factor BamE [Methylococcales bacterium]